MRNRILKYFKKDKKVLGFEVLYLSFLIGFIGWIVANIVLPNPQGFINFLMVLVQPPQGYILLALLLIQGYIWEIECKTPMETSEMTIERLRRKVKNQDKQIRFTDSRSMIQSQNIVRLTCIINELKNRMCPICLAELEEYLEITI